LPGFASTSFTEMFAVPSGLQIYTTEVIGFIKNVAEVLLL